MPKLFLLAAIVVLLALGRPSRERSRAPAPMDKLQAIEMERFAEVCRRGGS
ncbi:hypothetical protein [Streptomyces sp. NPDC087294]|uniref:hypothetical protein n=1 Tax=Streptomyces sp. NPDC087294 TaxID=3365777 RepID=UPI003801B31B